MHQHKLKIKVRFSVSRESFNSYFFQRAFFNQTSTHQPLGAAFLIFSFLLSYFFPTGTYLEEVSHQTIAGTLSPPNTVKQSLFPQRIICWELSISLFTRLHNSTYVQRHWKITRLSWQGRMGDWDRPYKTYHNESFRVSCWYQIPEKLDWSSNPAGPYEELAGDFKFLQGNKDTWIRFRDWVVSQTVIRFLSCIPQSHRCKPHEQICA